MTSPPVAAAPPRYVLDHGVNGEIAVAYTDGMQTRPDGDTKIILLLLCIRGTDKSD